VGLEWTGGARVDGWGSNKTFCQTKLQIALPLDDNPQLQRWADGRRHGRKRMAAAPATCWRGRQQSTCGRRIARAPPTSTLAPRHSLAAPSTIHVGLCWVLAVVWAADSLSTLRCLTACRRSSLSFDACSQLASWRGERHRGPTPSDWWHLAATTASPAISLPGSGPCLRPTAVTYSRLLLASTLC
jgi:hypothetical protein